MTGIAAAKRRSLPQEHRHRRAEDRRNLPGEPLAPAVPALAVEIQAERRLRHRRIAQRADMLQRHPAVRDDRRNKFFIDRTSFIFHSYPVLNFVKE